MVEQLRQREWWSSPEYVAHAEDIGARFFSMPQADWEALTPYEQWAANQEFLDDAISRGQEFWLATPLDEVIPGSFFEREIEYVLGRGGML